MSKKTFVGTQVQRVIPDEQLGHSVQTGVIKSLVKNGELIDYVLEEMVNSVGVRAERMFDWANAGNYLYGMPSGQFDTDLTGHDEMIQVLETLEGASVTIDYKHLGPANRLHIGWMSLVANHGYNPATNIFAGLTAQKLSYVYLKDMWVVVPTTDLAKIEPRQLETWGIAARAGVTVDRLFNPYAPNAPQVIPTPFKTSPTATADYLHVVYQWFDEDTNSIKEGSFDIPITDYDDRDNFFHARYRVGLNVKFFMYKDNSGTYPTLDAVISKPPVVGGQFFPFLYFRYNGDSDLESTATEHYRDSKKLAKYLGIDYQDMGDAINGNPDIDDVEQAMIMFAIPVNTTNELERRYLFDFLNSLYTSVPTSGQYRSSDEASIVAAGGGEIAELNSLVIQDSRFRMLLTNAGIYKRRKAGNIGKIGEHASGTYNETTTISVQSDSAAESSTVILQDVVTPFHYFRRQISKNFYDEIVVKDLQTVFRIYGRYSTIGDGADSILIVPLDHAITETYSLPDREILYARSMHYVFNSVVVIKLKWYQESFFQFFLIVVAIIVTVVTYGSDGGSLLSFAVATGNIVLAAQIILITLLEQFLVAQLFKLFVKAVGVDTAFVLAIVAALAGSYQAISQTGGLASAPWAKELLALSTGLSNAVQVQLGADMADLVDQANEFAEYQEEMNAELQTAAKLLEGNLHLSPFLIFGEKPSEYFNRTVHSGNIGVLVGIQSVSTFVDVQLRLPTLAETLGEADDEL